MDAYWISWEFCEPQHIMGSIPGNSNAINLPRLGMIRWRFPWDVMGVPPVMVDPIKMDDCGYPENEEPPPHFWGDGMRNL